VRRRLIRDRTANDRLLLLVTPFGAFFSPLSPVRVESFGAWSTGIGQIPFLRSVDVLSLLRCDSCKRIRNGHFPIRKRARIDIPLRDKRRITGGDASAWADPQAGSVWDTHEFKESFQLSGRDFGGRFSIPTARSARFLCGQSYCYYRRFPRVRTCARSTTSTRAGEARDYCER
jgi:hypothetical protein